jgi:folate-binding protein YgfZ
MPAELNDDHNPFELGLAGRVGLSKGCYVGQETLAKLATYDGVKQQLRRWHWRLGEGGPAPEAGQGLFNPGPEGGSQEGRLGRITSVLELADGDRIGLAMVRRAGLEQAQLLAGKDPGAAQLNLSLPEQFLAPPVGAGGG